MPTGRDGSGRQAGGVDGYRTPYWNHNTAYHPELVAEVRRRGGSVLDVGCGDGLLLSRLAPFARRAVGIDLDPTALGRARDRLVGWRRAELVEADLRQASDGLAGERFDTVTCVATLHHVPLVDGLTALRRLLAPGGRLLIIGLAANGSPADWATGIATLLPIRALGRWHRESNPPGGVRIAEPAESLHRIAGTSARMLPGRRLRRRLYYRYSLTWTAAP